VRFAVTIHPGARKNASAGEFSDALQSFLNLATVEGRGHEASIEFFAKLLKRLRCSVTIASGQTRRGKRIRVSRLSAEDVRQHVAMETRVKHNEGTAGEGARAQK
jgi:uncharacterized protein YggU (UPF0235/DUF167 family)